MCGFVVCVSGSTASAPDLTDALAAVYHRGPDDGAQLNAGPCVFGFRRLAIIDRDLSRQPLQYPVGGHQAGRWTVVCNGEIYNYRELRAELTSHHGCEFATEGDVEVLAAALHVWGIEALSRLRGMYAFVAWDSVEGVVHAGRDPFGIKPLYYAATDGGLWLSSEKKSLMSTVDSDKVDVDALSYYLTLQYVPEPHTMHHGINRLAAGERLEFRPGNGLLTVESWARPMFRPQPLAAVDPAEVQKDIQDALRDSVRAHMISDVPVGAFLSSGIDSTAVVALAREIKPDIQTFTAGFDETGDDELEVAARTAVELGVRNIPTVVTADDVLAALPRIIWHLDDPIADPSLVPLYFLARTASRHVTVTLSGEGADELFGGYGIYREPASLAPVQRLPQSVQRGLRGFSKVIPEGVKGRSFLDRATTPIEQRYFGNARIFSDEEKVAMLRGPVASHTDVTAAAYAEATELDDVATMQYVDLRTWLPGDILSKADRMSMAHSLELRVPFLDRRVFAAAAQVPTDLKLPPGTRTTKAALRGAMRGIVPASIVNRPKLGFPTPTRIWLRGPIGEWAGDMIAQSEAGDVLDLGYAQRLLAEHRSGSADHSRKVWTVLTFCLWYAIFVERTLSVLSLNPTEPVLSGVAPLQRPGVQPSMPITAGWRAA
jgi:asparagine synthase (glutamine-hydrolysing)